MMASIYNRKILIFLLIFVTLYIAAPPAGLIPTSILSFPILKRFLPTNYQQKRRKETELKAIIIVLINFPMNIFNTLNKRKSHCIFFFTGRS